MGDGIVVPNESATGSKLDSVVFCQRGGLFVLEWLAQYSFSSNSQKKVKNERSRKASERTNIVFPRISSILHRRRYFASTMPAGHNWPPHPSFASDSSTRGGVRRPSKSRVVRRGAVGGIEGTRSSGKAKNVLFVLSEVEGVVMVLLLANGRGAM